MANIQNSTVTVTAEPNDHLTAIPTEVQHLIIGNLFATHEPNKAFECIGDLTTSKKTPASHPFDSLAATCKTFRGEVNQWCLLFLTNHGTITNYKPLKNSKNQAERNFIRGRGGLLTWCEKHCVFCGKKSARSAILMNGLHCCTDCDNKEHWPDKITKTQAKKEYDLRDDHLHPPLAHHSGPSLAKLLTTSPAMAKLYKKFGSLSKLRYGTYMSHNVPTTMFLRKDVLAQAQRVHGDVEAHLAAKEAKKQAKRDEKARKAREAAVALDIIQQQQAAAALQAYAAAIVPLSQVVQQPWDQSQSEFDKFLSQHALDKIANPDDDVIRVGDSGFDGVLEDMVRDGWDWAAPQTPIDEEELFVF